MNDIAQIEMREDGRIVMVCQLPCGRGQRYTFSSMKMLILFVWGLHRQVNVNLARLDRPGPVPADLMKATQHLLAVIREVVIFCDWHTPQSQWGKELTEAVIGALGSD